MHMHIIIPKQTAFMVLYPFPEVLVGVFAFHGSQYTPVNRFCQHLFA